MDGAQIGPKLSNVLPLQHSPPFDLVPLMPYELIWEEAGVYKRFWGDVSGLEIAKSVEQVSAHPRFDEIRYILNDFLDADVVDSLDAETSDRMMAQRIGATFTNPRFRVLIVSRNPRLVAIADLTKPPTPPDSNKAKGFATVIEAREWFARQPRLD